MQTAIRIILIALLAGLIAAGTAAIKHQRSLPDSYPYETATTTSEELPL